MDHSEGEGTVADGDGAGGMVEVDKVAEVAVAGEVVVIAVVT